MNGDPSLELNTVKELCAVRLNEHLSTDIRKTHLVFVMLLRIENDA